LKYDLRNINTCWNLGVSPPITRCLDAFLCVASSSRVERVEVAVANLFPFTLMQLIRYDHRLLFPSIQPVGSDLKTVTGWIRALLKVYSGSLTIKILQNTHLQLSKR
jgi:hypothetical protein